MASDQPTVELMKLEFGRLDLKPGDVLIVSLPDYAKADHFESVKANVLAVGIQNKVLMVTNTIQFGVLSPV